MAQCKACGKEIEFFKNEKTGKFMPFDAKAIPILFDDSAECGTGKMVRLGQVPHWVTCSDPARFRKENG